LHRDKTPSSGSGCSLARFKLLFINVRISNYWMHLRVKSRLILLVYGRVALVNSIKMAFGEWKNAKFNGLTTDATTLMKFY